MDIPITLFLLIAGGLSALYLLLFRGDEEWYVPIVGAALALMAPLVVHLIFSALVPFAESPIYVYGVLDIQKHLEWAYEQIHRVSEAAFFAAKAAIYAMEGVYAAATAALAVVGGGAVGATAGRAVLRALQLAGFAEPLSSILTSAYNVAMGIAMAYHVLETVAWAAMRFTPLLLYAGMALMPFPRARAVGGVLLGMGLLLYAGAMAGGYFAKPAMALANWTRAIAEWADLAPKPPVNASLASAFFYAEGGGMYFAKYNATLRMSRVYELWQEVVKAALPINISYYRLAFVNGSDYISGAGYAPMWNGNATWTGIDRGYPYAVYAWLDVPRAPQRLPWVHDYSQVYAIASPNETLFVIYPTAPNQEPENITVGQYAERVMGAWAGFLNATTPFWRAYTGPQPFWRLLYAQVIVHVNLTRHTRIYSGVEGGVIGVWGWIRPPEEQRCYLGDRAAGCGIVDVTFEPGLYQYNIEENVKAWDRPSTRNLVVRLNASLPPAPKPVRDGHLDFYRWKETCEWCERWECDPSGYCYCAQWASTTREVREEPRWRKYTEVRELEHNASLYQKPWVPSAEDTVRVRVPYTYRGWEVWKEVVYGPWNNGDPPPGAYCYTHDVSPYKRVVFWDVRRSVKDAYAFAWLSAVHTAGSLGPPLPDYYEDGPAEEDGFTVINLLRGAEYGWECHWRVLSAYRPEWDLVPAANANMTELHRKYALYLLAQGEYANARADFVLSVAGEPPPIGPAQYAAEVLRGVRKAFNGVAFYPLPEPAPDSYHSFNLLLVCFRFDWANETVKAPASVVMEPGLEPWLFRFALADSRLSRLTAERLSAMWAWVFEHPPPPPPLEAGRFLPAPWPVPWNGWMPLPYNASPGAPLYYATFMGVPMWPVFGLAVAGAYVMAAWASLYPNVYIGLLMAIAALEALSALFAFPSAGVLLAKFVWQVLEDLAFWYQIRLLIKSRLFARVFKAAHPVRAAARRVVQRLYYKGYLKVSGRRRWELDRMLTPVGEMERGLERRVVRRLEEAAEKALRKIGESKVGQAVGEATKAVERAWSHARWEAAGAMWERAKEAGRRAWRIAQCHDVVCAAREVSARVDRWFDAKVAEAASKRPLSYLLFWAHFDPHGRRWAAALNTALYYGMLRRGQITGREFEELKNYRDYLIAVRLAERLKALRQASVEEAAEAAKEATERATAASLTAMSQLAEALRKGAAAEEVEKLLAEVYKPLAELHQGAFSKLAEIIAAALGEKKAPETPRELAELLVRKAADFLAVEPQIRRTWAEEWSYQLSFAGYAKALAARELEERLGELYLLTLAWDVARGRLERLGEAKAAVAVAKAKAETLAELREALARRGLEPREAEAFLKTATSRVKEDLFRVMEAFGVEISFIKLLKIDEERLAKALGEAGRAAKLAEAAVKAVEEAKASLSRIEAAGLGEAGARLLEAARRALEEVLRGGGEEAVRQFKAEAEAIRRGLSGEAEKSVRQLEERVAEVLQKAAERLEAVRREAYKRLREIAHDFLWVGRSEPLFTIALPGAEEALRAAERALRAFAEGADREAVLRQFREEVAKVKQQYAALGADVRHLEGIEREVASVLQRLERPLPVKAPEDAAAKAELVRRALAALSDDRTAKLALALYARGVDVDEALAARRAYEIVARGEHAGAVLEAEAAVKRLAEKAAELITALERYAEAKAAAELAREPYEAVRLFAGADRLRAELLAKAAEVREVAEAAKAAVMKVRAVEEALEKAPVGLKKSEARLPERPDLSVLAQAFKERVERLKTAGAERERLLAELRALAELLRQAPAEAVKKAFAEAGIEFRAGSVEKAEAFAEAWRLAEALNKFAAWAAAAKEYGELAREAEGAAHSLAKEMSNLREVLERRLEGRAYDNAVKAQIARVRAAEEHLRAAVEALKALERPPLEAARVEKTEAKTPRDAVLAVLVDLFKQKVEELREARGEEREKLLRQVRELASEVRQWPRELVAEAFKGADVYVRPGSVSVDKEAVEEARARLRELSAALGVESEKLMLWASVTHKAAEAVRRLREAEDVLRGHREIVEILNKGEVSDKELAKLRSELRELARALDLYPELAEFLRSPSFSADLAALARAAERLGLPEAVKFISAVEEARFAVDKHGFRRYYSEVYQEVLGTMTPAWQKALLKAPIGAHVVNAMGLDLAREVFARYDFLRQFGEALADISPYVPARLGLPVPVFDPALIGVVTPPKTYPEKLAKHIASWDDLGVQEGIRRFYKTDLGLKHRAVAEIAALGAKAVAFRRLAERLVKEGREGGDVYKQIAGLLIAARAAREELRIAALAEAAGAGQQAKLLRESAVRLYASAVGEAFRLARELPVYELAEGLRPLLGNKARLVLEGVKGEDKLRRALERLSAVIDLRELYRIYGEAYLARAMYAEYVYLSLSKGLRERPRAVEPGYAVEAARALEGPVAHQRRVVEDAVAAAVPDWLRQRLEELRGALQMADPATAPNYLKPYARGFGDFRSQFNAFVEEVRRVAEFSPAAKQVLITVAKYLAGDKRLEEYEGVRDWLPERDALAKYLGVRMLQVLREAEPARAPTVEHLERLPEAVKRAVAFEERVLVREGYYDERLRAVYKALGLEFVREHPSLAASGLEGAIETLAARHGLSAEEAVKALRELRNAPVDAVLEKARAAGEAVMEFLAEVAKTRILEEVTRRGAYYDADLAYREAKAVLERVEKIAAVKFSEGAAADVLIRLVDAERLREGLLSNEPVPLGVMAARDVETALALGHRFKIIPLNAEFLEGGVSRAERLYLVVHPALEEAVERLREQIAAELARSYYLELRHLGAAPPEIALKIPGVVGVREGDTLHLYVKDKVDELAKAAARALADGDKETAGRLLRRLRLVWLLVAKKYGVDLRGDEAVGYAVMKELVEALKAKWLSGEREALFKWAHDPEIAGGMLKLLGAEGDPDLLIFGVKYWLEWLVRGSLAPPDFPEALIPAARLYAEVTLEPYRDVLMRIYRRLGEIRIHYAQRLREVVEAELRRIGALPEGAKPPEKRPEEVKRPAERPLERPAKAAKPAEGLAEAAKPSTEAIEKPAAVEKPAERPSPAAEKTAEGRPAEVKKPAAGLIPEGLFGVQAALWLRRRLGSRDVGYEEARWLGEAVRKAKDYALWKALRGKAPETLREYLEEAGARAWAVLSELAASPEAVRYAALLAGHLEDAYRGVLETAFAQDAYRLFKPVIEVARRAEEELGAGDVVIRFVDLFVSRFAKEAERLWDKAYKAAATVEQALKAAAVSAAGTAGLIATHDAVFGALPAIAAAIALARADKYREAAEAARKAAERIYEAAKEIWEAARVTLQKIYEAVVEAIARALDYVKAHWFLLAAVAAGIITYSLAQQLDFKLWQDHVAKLAPLIAGVPAFKKAELPLKEVARQVWEAAWQLWERGREELKALVDRLNSSGWLKGQAVDAIAAVKKAEKIVISRMAKRGGPIDEIRRVDFTWKDVALAYTLLEAAYRHVSPPDVKAMVNKIAEELKSGKAVDATEYYKQLRAFLERVREAEWRLRARLWEIRESARELGLTEGEFELELAEELARANALELNQFGNATLADKVLAFVLGLATDAIYSRAVLELAKRGEGPRAPALTPSSVYQKYVKQKGARDEAEEPFRVVLVKLLAALAALDLKDVIITPKLLTAEGGALEVVARVRTEEGVKEVSGEVAWEKLESSITIHIKGGLLNFLKNEKFVEGIKEDDTVKNGFVRGWLTTDASVGEGVIMANTTSLFQAALYKASGFEGVRAEDMGSVTEAGFKVTYRGSSSVPYHLYLEIANGVRALLGLVKPLNDEAKKAVEESLKKLDRAREAVEALVGKLLAEDKLTVSKAAGLTAEEVAERVKKAASDILSPEAARKIDPVEHSAYGRVYYPLVDLLLRDASEVEFAQFFAAAIFGDGAITPYHVVFTLGEFDSNALPYDRFHKLALWLAVVEKYRPVFEKYGVDITPRVYVRKNVIFLRFDLKAAGLLFALGGRLVWRIYDEYVRAVGRNLWDTGFIKAERMLETVKEAFEDVKVMWRIDESIGKPVLRVQFVKEVGGREVEISSLNVYVHDTPTGKALHAKFGGSREKAEALASLLRAWGAEAEAKPSGKDWNVDLMTGQLYAVDHPEFKRALEAFIAKAKEMGLLTEEQAERKLTMINAGPNTVEIAGAEFSVRPIWKGTKVETVEIVYWTTDKAQLENAAKALEDFGLLRGADFIAKWREAGRGDIWLKAGALEKAVEALKADGFKEGEDFIVYRAKEGGGRIRVKNPGQNLDKVREAFKKGGLVEGEDYTVSSEIGYIRITIPEGLWTIAWKAKKGDTKAQAFLDQLLNVAGKLGIRQYFEERIRPVLLAGTKNAVGRKETVESVTVEITNFKVEWVQLKNTDEPCKWPAELCRPKVIISYKVGEDKQEFTVMWGVRENSTIYAEAKKMTLDKAAALIAVAIWEDDEEERNRIIERAKKGGNVWLSPDNLLAMAQYDASLLEWYMAVKRAQTSALSHL